MDTAKVNELREQAMQAAKDAVKAQVAKGAPAKGMNNERHAAVLAYVIAEALSGLADPSNPDETKPVLRAILTPALLNPSQLRQSLERAGVLQAEGKLATEYAV